MVGTISDSEKNYGESLRDARRRAKRIGQADIVAGIPFRNEADAVGRVCRTVAKGLSDFYPGRKCVIVCAGSVEGKDALGAIEKTEFPRGIRVISFLMGSDDVSGSIWTLRAIVEIAARLGAELALFEAGLGSGTSENDGEGLSPDWVRSLVLPLEEAGMDLVVPRFSSDRLGATASNQLVCPLIGSVFNTPIADLPGGLLGASSKLVRMYRDDAALWAEEVEPCSVDTLLVTSAIMHEVRICETVLGLRLHEPCADEETLWRQQAKTIFERVRAARDWWQQKGEMFYPPAVFGDRRGNGPQGQLQDPVPLLEHYRQGFNKFQGLYEEILSREAALELRKLAGSDVKDFSFSSALWAEIVQDFLLTYALEQRFSKDGILDAFVPMCYGRAAGYIRELQTFRDVAEDFMPGKAERLTSLAAAQELESLANEFIRLRSRFVSRWGEKEKVLKPLLPKVTYREFIPGVPLIVPKDLVAPTGEIVSTERIYRDVLESRRNGFEEFVYGRLGIARDATSSEIVERLEALMREVERDVGELLVPGDLSTVDGTEAVAEGVFANFPHSETYALTPDVTAWILRQNPPSNLLIKYGASSLADLERRYGFNDMLALSGLSEPPEHSARVWDWLAGNARPEHFARLEPQSLVVDCDEFPMLTLLREPSSLSKLAGRIAVSNLPPGAGGEFPKMRYLVTMAKHIVEAEVLGGVWQQFARERKEFGTRVVNSLKGHWGGEPFSAHNMFENGVQRETVQKLKKMARSIGKNGDPSLSRLGKNLGHIVDSYHLAMTLRDGMFIPCSAWTWASYSYKGGMGVPTPLSLHVERDWASREFMVQLLEAIGVSEEGMERKITELMGRGLESENLARLMLPGWEVVEEVMPKQLLRPAEPKAGMLHRFAGNPILSPVPEHQWEEKYVFNAGVIRLGGKIHILYRACGEDEVSRIGLAVSSDGLHIDERLEEPIFGPKDDWETRGCEDPRLIQIGSQVHMLYTAYDSIVAQIAMASINVEDFLNRRWGKWKRHGLVFPGSDNKDATLFPEMFGGRYVMFHRIEPSIWTISSEGLAPPWPREGHRILLGPGAGMAWDGVKIGGGSQPIKTKFGWLLIYHGVDHSWVYRLGVMLVDLDDPGRLVYRSPGPVLEPEESYELGEAGSYVPNVVFTCGAVPKEDKAILDEDDEILVYYGAADTVICVATAKVSDLVPVEVRQGRSHDTYHLR